MIHTCIGVYPDKSYKVNYISSERLAANIAYNLQFRLGRIYYVDGSPVSMGCMTLEAFRVFDSWAQENIIQKIKPSTIENPTFI